MSAHLRPAGTSSGDIIPDDDEARWRAAKQLRREKPGWLVIWVARTCRFHAYRLTGPRQGIPLTGQNTGDLGAQIDQAEEIARRPRGRSAPGRPGHG